MNILAVLENEAMQLPMTQMLSALKPEANLLCFGSSLPALAAARTQEIDIAVLDAKLPELSGLDFGQYLQELYESELRNAAGTAGSAGFHFPGMAPWGGLSADTWQRGGSSAQEGITPGDMESFRGLPGAMQNAIREGAKAGVSGIKVVMDGVTVGRLVAPTVSQEIARSMP